MKISVAYIPAEQEEAAAVLAALRRLCPGIKVKESDRHPPFKHIYLTTKKPGNPCNSRETLDFPEN